MTPSKQSDRREPGTASGNAGERSPCLGAACRQRIYERAWSLLTNPEDVEDFVQEVCVRCLTEQGVPRGKPSFGSWLELAVLRAFRDLMWERVVTEVTSESELRRGAFDAAIEASHAAGVSPEESPQLQKVQAALARLTPRQYQLLQWKYVEGRSYDEIGQELGITPPSARCALYRARRKFQRAYDAPSREAGGLGA